MFVNFVLFYKDGKIKFEFLFSFNLLVNFLRVGMLFFFFKVFIVLGIGLIFR